MRWLLVSDELPWPLHHGTYLRVFHLARRLVALGDEVALLTGRDSGGGGADRFASQSGAAVHACPDRGLREGFSCFYPVNAAIEGAISSLDEPFDAAIVFHARSLAYCGSLRKRLPEATIIADLIDDYGLEQRGRFRGDLLSPLTMLRRIKHIAEHRRLESRCAGSVDIFSFVGQADAESFAAHLPDARTAVIPNGVDIEYFRPSEARIAEAIDSRKASPGPVLVFPGRFVHPPNVQAADYLVKAVAPVVRSACPDLEIVILGADPPERLSRLAGPGVRVTGFVEDMRPELWRADLVCLPMLSGAGIKNKLLEAWAAGVAVVATPLACRGARAVDGENVLITAPNRMAEAIIGLLGDGGRRNSLATAGLKTVCDHYTWTAAAETFRALAGASPTDR